MTAKETKIWATVRRIHFVPLVGDKKKSERERDPDSCLIILAQGNFITSFRATERVWQQQHITRRHRQTDTDAGVLLGSK